MPVTVLNGDQELGVLWSSGIKTTTNVKDSSNKIEWQCAAREDCVQGQHKFGLGVKGHSNTSALKHLREVHGIVGQEPGSVVAVRNKLEMMARKQADIDKIGKPRVAMLAAALLLIRACLPFAHVELPEFRIGWDGGGWMSRANARRHVGEIYLSFVESTRANIIKARKGMGGLPAFWWNADLWTFKVCVGGV